MEIEQIDHYATPIGVEHHFSIVSEIEGPESFSDFFAILRQAGEEDVVYLHINSPGGRLDTTVQIINAMNECRAPVVTCAEGDIASGAAIIFFSGDAFKIASHCEFLIHTASGGNLGKISDNLSSVKFAVKRMEHLYEEVLGGFLTEEELTWVSRGEEFYLSSEDVKERIQGYMDRREQEEEEDGKDDMGAGEE